MTNATSDHPPVDWSKWEPAGEGDGTVFETFDSEKQADNLKVRSPCPFMNSLANHHIFPHNGKGITKEMAVKALTTTINFDATVAGRFFDVALWTNPNHATTHSLDLDHLSRHGIIEHDVSLSRSDATLGNNASFNEDIWLDVVESFGDIDTVTVQIASGARYNRLIACKQAHTKSKKDFVYGIKEMAFSYGESALYLSVMGNPETKMAPLKYIKVLFGKLVSKN
jgi:hypothetical protein